MGDVGNATIRKVELATGIVTTVAGSVGVTGAADGTGGAATFTAPTALAFDGAGDLLVSDHGSATIRKLVVATGVVTTLAGTATDDSLHDLPPCLSFPAAFVRPGEHRAPGPADLGMR